MRVQKIRKLFKIAVSFFKYQLNPRPKVWWSCFNENDPYAIKSKENFGDILTPYIVNKISNRLPIYFDLNKEQGARFIKHSIMIGSIIRFSRSNTIVWGSGLISNDETVKSENILAVRGPLTAERINKNRDSSIKVFGDPALLLNLLYNPIIVKKYEVGIIPHFVDYNDLMKLKSESVDVINLMTNDIEDVVNRILACKRVISTSLHGIIVANSYSIPAIWATYSNRLDGDNVKFYDYFKSVGLLDVNVYKIDKMNIQDILDIDENLFLVPRKEVLDNLNRDLLKSFPYKIRNQIIKKNI